MLMHGVAPRAIAGRLGISPEQLATRQASMLRALTPTRGQPVQAPDGAAPLDYERPKRRSILTAG
jgi:hypothetical protein